MRQLRKLPCWQREQVLEQVLVLEQLRELGQAPEQVLQVPLQLALLARHNRRSQERL